MARKVFFSFHYERDIKRVGQIRNSGLTKPDLDSAGFVDSASWESIKKQGVEAIKKWIAGQMDGTSVTVVLIGAETSEREWVRYEIKESLKKRNALLGIYIHNVVDLDRKTDIKGKNPFDQFYFMKNGKKIYLSQFCRTYDWINNNGYENFGQWVEESFENKGNLEQGELFEIAEAISNKSEAVFANFNYNSGNKGFAPRSPWRDSNANLI